jgi:hypothetical protein
LPVCRKNPTQYIESIIEMKKKYNIQCFLIVFILLEYKIQKTEHELKEKCLFIVSSDGTWECMDIIKEYFEIDITANINELGEFH